MSTLEKTLNNEIVKNRTATKLFIWVLVALGWSSGILFMIFLFTGSFTIINLHLDFKNALIVDAVLSILFFLQHSIFVRRGFKQRLTKFMPGHYHNAFYGLTSDMALTLVLIFWQSSPAPIAAADGIFYWTLRGLFFLSIAGFYWGVKALGSFDALGVKPLLLHMNNKEAKPQQVRIKGPYRWVRHPLYFFMIILFCSCPVLTPDRLLFNILWTVWIVTGTYLEDRDLHREFGSSYSAYSAQVPMLIPYRIPKN